MIALDPLQASRDAVATSPTRPATAILHDSPDLRLVVFRILPGQSVAPHHNPSTVTLTVLEGAGFLSGGEGERACRAGEMVTYEPGETHGMRSERESLYLLATITPRPGAREVAAVIAHGEGR